MSNYAVVLQKGNLVVKASNFGDVVNIKFTKDGKVDEFIYAGKAYYAIYQYSSTVFIDYVEKERFSILKKNEIEKEKDKYDGVDISLWKDLIFNQYRPLDKAVVNDDIFGVLRDDTGLCFYYYTWKYTDNYTEPVGAVNAFYPPRKADYPCDDFGGNVTAITYYNSLKDQEFYDLETGTSKKDIRLVAEVANLISKVDKQMLEAFNQFTTIVGEHGEFKIIENSTNTYYRNVLTGYRDGLKKWLQLYEKYKNELKDLDDPAQLYVICDILYRYNMLGTLTVDQKISILLTFCTRPLMDWYFVNFKEGFQQRETLVVRVIDSVRNDQAPEFLSKLISTKLFLIKPSYYLSALPLGSLISTPQFTEMNLYRVLFQKIDDYFGPDNFTTFIKTLQRLVLAKNGIILPQQVNKIDYDLDELKAKTDKLFMWGNIRNENKVKYSVKKKNNEKIVFVERICSKINRVEIQNSNSLGIPTNNSFTVAICEDYVEKEIEVKHFDLVAIAFFDNPSFIDLGEATSFVDQRFLTFGGFIDYLLEKENTKLVEKVIVAGLTVLSMAIGVGEIVAFMRGASYLRLLAGIGILTGDTIAYLAQDTEFRNYIIQKYPQDHDTILTVLMWAGIILSAGGSSAVGTGILKTYSAKQAAEFIGIAEQVVLEPSLYAKLTINEKNILENGIKTFENGLYRIKYDPELIKITNRAKGTIKFYDSGPLRAEIMALDEASRLRFLDVSANFSREIVQLFKLYPNQVAIILNYTTEAQNLIYSKIDIWFKYVRLRDYLINGRFDEIALLFNKAISEPTIVNGVRYVTDGSFVVTDIERAIEIANRTDDIDIISNKLGIPTNILAKAKKHYYIDEHLIQIDGTFQFGRFERDLADNTEWLNMINKPFSLITTEEIKSFKSLIAHEYIESELMKRGINFRSYIDGSNMLPYDNGAHWLAPNWDAQLNLFYPNLGRKSIFKPPLPNLNSFNNLDEIVNWYVDFYKL